MNKDTKFPIALSLSICLNPREDTFGDSKSRVYRGQPVLFWLEERKGCDSEEGVEDVHCISWPVADASFFLVLAVENEELERVLVDPVLFSHHTESRVDPPGVTDIRQLLGPAVEASFGRLSLAQPFGQQLLVK